MSDIVTRKLVRQEWRPLAGTTVVRYVASSAGYSMPGDEWTDDLPGTGEIQNEVMALVEMETGRRFPSFKDRDAFVDAVREEADILLVKDGWEDVFADDAEDDADTDSEPVEAEEVSDPSSSEETSDDGAEDGANGDVGGPLMVTTDGSGARIEEVYDSDNEPYILPRDAGEEDLREGVIYESEVNAIEPYGIFVSVRNTHHNHNDVSGLLHQQNMGIRKPNDFTVGQTAYVEVDDFEKGVSFILHATDTESVRTGLDKLFPENNND